jgi:hypothetical protein
MKKITSYSKYKLNEATIEIEDTEEGVYVLTLKDIKNIIGSFTDQGVDDDAIIEELSNYKFIKVEDPTITPVDKNDFLSDFDKNGYDSLMNNELSSDDENPNFIKKFERFDAWTGPFVGSWVQMRVFNCINKKYEEFINNNIGKIVDIKRKSSPDELEINPYSIYEIAYSNVPTILKTHFSFLYNADFNKFTTKLEPGVKGLVMKVELVDYADSKQQLEKQITAKKYNI